MPAVSAARGSVLVLGAEPYLEHTTDWYGRWRYAANAGNDYQIDRAKQRSSVYTGIMGINLQDQAITESMGSVVDRTREHLAPSDAMITATRRRLLSAVKAMKKDGAMPPGACDGALYGLAMGGYLGASEGRTLIEIYEEETLPIRLSPTPTICSVSPWTAGKGRRRRIEEAIRLILDCSENRTGV